MQFDMRHKKWTNFVHWLQICGGFIESTEIRGAAAHRIRAIRKYASSIIVQLQAKHVVVHFAVHKIPNYAHNNSVHRIK